MSQQFEALAYLAIAVGILVLNHLVMGDMPELKDAGLLVLGAVIGFIRGGFVPPVTAPPK